MKSKYLFFIALIIILCVMFLLNYKYAYNKGRDSTIQFGHPFPSHHEMYEAMDPETGEPIVRVLNFVWSDNTRKNYSMIFFDSSGESIVLDMPTAGEFGCPYESTLERFDATGKNIISMSFSKLYRDKQNAWDLKGNWPYLDKDVKIESTGIVYHVLNRK